MSESARAGDETQGERVIRRLAGVIVRPRATLAQVIQAQTWAATWLLLLMVWAVCGGALLATDVGRQAVVDERVRAIEAFGGTVTDAEYASFQAHPPWWVYLVSGSRALLLPPMTWLVAAAIRLVARAMHTRTTTMSQALAIAVHASVVLLVGQIVATPLHYVRESLTSPLNLATILPLMEEGTAFARFFGAIDLFALWWAALLAVGLSILTGRNASRFLLSLLALFAVFAAALAAAMAAVGGA